MVDQSKSAADGRVGRRGSRVASGLVVALVVAAAGGAAWWWREREHAAERAARAYGTSVASALAAGTLPPDLDVEDRAAAQQGLDRIMDGMGDLEHRVTVGRVDLGDDDTAGRVYLDHTWRIHADKEPWAYRTTLPVKRIGSAWRGEWSAQVAVAGLGEGERVRAVRLNPKRGDIRGDGDTVLVQLREVVRLGIDRNQVPDPDAAQRSARRLASLVDIDEAEYVARVSTSGPSAFVEAITYRVGAVELRAAAAALADIPGATTVTDEAPLAPTSGFARPILGTSGAATAEAVDRSGGRVRPGDLVGLSGLQATHDETLAGTAGYTVEAVDLGTEKPRRLHQVPARDGAALRTTLSERHQVAAEAALESLVPASSIVAIRPSDGHLLAVASGPGSKGYSTATLGQYAPGSTFKAVSSLALLRAGLRATSVVDCPATTTVDGRTFKNFDDYPPARLGRISLRTVVANSCNTGLMQQRGRLTPRSLPDAAASLGLTAEPRLGVPAELGSVPEPSTDVEMAASMIGQGKVLSTPLGMATVAASLATGTAVSPVLVPGDGVPARPATATLSDAEHTQMLDMLRAVVTEGGATSLRDVPGEQVRAKTGTAEYGEAGADGTLATHAWMIGMQGNLAVAVFVERGRGGSSVAGPVLEDFLRRVGRK
ncbi:MAG: penicillin-binding transpeptidase domain-containing protein [Dermatophilaceae bacterium]